MPTDEAFEAKPSIPFDQATNVIQCEINNRLGARQQLHEKLVSLDGEIAGLREAQYRIERLTSKG